MDSQNGDEAAKEPLCRHCEETSTARGRPQDTARRIGQQEALSGPVMRSTTLPKA